LTQYRIIFPHKILYPKAIPVLSWWSITSRFPISTRTSDHNHDVEELPSYSAIAFLLLTAGRTISRAAIIAPYGSSVDRILSTIAAASWHYGKRRSCTFDTTRRAAFDVDGDLLLHLFLQHFSH
jgi:hypothetical protein